MKNYRAILFDLDGTLTYSHTGIHACFRYALEKMGETPPTKEQLARCIGPSLMYSFQTFFGLSEEKARQATAFYRERYAIKGIWENEEIPGAVEMLKRLKEKGYLLAMATSKPLHFASQISKKFGFAPYLDVEVGSGMDEKTLATKSAVVAEVVRLLGVDSSECLMVGDRIHDAEGAKENQMDCALLRVGYAENEEEFDRAKPTYRWENFEELIQNLA